MLGWGEASAWHRRLGGLHCIPTATQMTGKPSRREIGKGDTHEFNTASPYFLAGLAFFALLLLGKEK